MHTFLLKFLKSSTKSIAYQNTTVSFPKEALKANSLLLIKLI